jgi:hypothetical protein
MKQGSNVDLQYFLYISSLLDNTSYLLSQCQCTHTAEETFFKTKTSVHACSNFCQLHHHHILIFFNGDLYTVFYSWNADVAPDNRKHQQQQQQQQQSRL